MNFNANAGQRPLMGRKHKRVMDVNSMGYSPYVEPSPFSNGTNTSNPPQSFPQQQPVPDFMSQNQYNQNFSKDMSYMNASQNDFNSGNFNTVPTGPGAAPNIAMFAQPMVQDMALQYGQQLANTGTNIVKKEIERFVPVSRLKYYFAVDTKYVLSKLRLLFFPFMHSDWSVKYEQDGPVQPRYEINAPDLYIPTMAYITYVLAASLVLGMQERFSPEQIGILASSALAWCIFEIAIYSCTLYITSIETSLRTFDLLAYSGYKFVGIIMCILLSLLGSHTFYYISLVYTNLALAFYLVRTLKVKVLPENTNQTGYYGESQTSGKKRRTYFLLFVAAVQPLLSWWLSFHLLSVPVPKPVN